MAMTQTDVVLYEVRDGVATLTLNRPERLNAWTIEMGEAYFDLLERAAADPDARVIVVTGAGRGFCPGLDMATLQGITDGDRPAPPRRPQTFPLSIPKPIIAAINGACAGIGLVQALMCDLRFAAAGAKFTTAFSRRGLIGEHAITWLLPRLVGYARALDLLLSARVFTAEEAAALGVVNRTLPPDRLMAETLAYARDVAANVSPASMAVIKAEVYRHLQTPLPEALEQANRLMVAAFGRPDVREGVESFVAKREPRFPPLDGDAGASDVLGSDHMPR